MNDSKFLPIYIKLLRLAKVDVSPEGYAILNLGDNINMKLRAAGKTVIMPTAERLANIQEDEIVFDLLPEALLADTTPILKGYTKLLSGRVNVIFATLCYQLLLALTTKQNRRNLSKGQLAFVDRMIGVDERTVNSFGLILQNMLPTQPERALVNTMVWRNGHVNRTPYVRVVRTTFPLYDALQKEGKVFDVTLRNKDRELFIKLLEFVLPGLDALDAYDAGSNNQVAPQLDAVMRCMEGLTNQFNHTLDAFFAGNPEMDDLRLKIDWVAPSIG